MSELNPYSGFELSTDVPGGAADLAELSSLAEQQSEWELKVKTLQKELKEAQDALTKISERTIPEKMDELGMESFKTRSGIKISVAEKIRASISKDNQPVAFDWLQKNGYSSLIKRKVSVGFGKGEDESAEKLVEELTGKYAYEDVASVHNSTLCAFVRESLEQGIEIPLDTFGVFRQRVAKIDT